MAKDFLLKCQKHIKSLFDQSFEIADETNEDVIHDSLSKLKIEPSIGSEFPPLDKLSEKPKFSQFMRLYERIHCENIQALLHYTASKF